MRIDAPDLNSRRALFADWLELLALTSATSQSSLSALRSHVRRASDDRISPKDFDPDADDSGEFEVTDRASDDLEERLDEEINFRIKTVGSAYPFELKSTGPHGASLILRRKSTWNQINSGELFYVFCLLDSCMREQLISVRAAKKSYVTRIGNIFQICSCIAVGGYTKAHVVSFGFPRATGAAFLPALQNAWAQYGSYKVRTNIPHGFDDKLKDGGVDIIAWRRFDDGHAATFLMFVQVASGMNWKNKPVAGDVKGIRQWFVDERFEHYVPAICIPFPLWFDLDEPAKNVAGEKIIFSEGVSRRFAIREATFGVIFDRGRIAQCCAAALSAPEGPSTLIDGVDRVHEVSDWVLEVMGHLAEKRSAV